MNSVDISFFKMNDDSASNLLDFFVSAAAEELPSECITKKKVSEQNEDEVFLEKISNFEQAADKKFGIQRVDPSLKKLNEISKGNSQIHSGETDSSDDEYNRDWENSKYNEFGKGIKQILSTDSGSSNNEANSYNLKTPSTWHASSSKNTVQQLSFMKKEPVNKDVYTDPFFGLRIVKPLISSTALKERMTGKEAIPFIRIKKHAEKKTFDQDWVIAGAIVHKYSKTSQKGNQFSIWTISDLQNELKTVSLFLFGGAHKNLWKTIQGTVIGVLNPSVLDKKDGSKDEVIIWNSLAFGYLIVGF